MRIVKFPYRKLRQALETFEPPRSGEITFGIAARFFEHCDLLSSQELHAYLHGYATTELASRIPGGLEVFYRRMKDVWGSPEQVLEHTIWPLFRIFQPSQDAADRIEDLLLYTKRSPGQQLRRMFVLSKGDAWEKRLLPRFCIECVLEDMRAGRQTTWYREHQIPGIDWCVRHKSALFDECLGCGATMFKNSYVLPPYHLRELTIHREPNTATECNIVRESSILPKSISCRELAFRQLGIGKVGRKKYPRPGIHANRPRGNYELQQLKMCALAVGLMDLNLPPIPASCWSEVLRKGIKERGLSFILRRIRKADLVEGAVGDLMLKTEISAIRDLARPSYRRSPRLVSVSPKKKLWIASLVFDTTDEFVETLKSTIGTWEAP